MFPGFGQGLDGQGQDSDFLADAVGQALGGEVRELLHEGIDLLGEGAEVEVRVEPDLVADQGAGDVDQAVMDVPGVLVGEGIGDLVLVEVDDLEQFGGARTGQGDEGGDVDCVGEDQEVGVVFELFEVLGEEVGRAGESPFPEARRHGEDLDLMGGMIAQHVGEGLVRSAVVGF